MLLLKACPRCRGDLVVEKEEFVEMVSCLQCGFSSDIATLRRIRAERALAAPVVSEPEREKAKAA